MFKQFIKDSTIYSVSAILGQGAMLILLPVYARVLTPAEIGMVDLIRLFMRFVYLAIALEIGQGFIRFYPDGKTEKEKNAYVSTALIFAFIIYIVFVILSLVYSGQLASLILDTPENTLEMRLTIFASFGYGFYILTQLLFRIRLESIKAAAVNLVLSIVTILSTLLFVYLFELGFLGVVSGVLAGYFASVMSSILLVPKSLQFIFDRVKFFEMLRYSLPLVPSSLGVLGAQYIDRIAVKTMMSTSDLGQIGVGYRIASPILLIMGAFAGSLTSLIYTHYKKPETAKELARIFKFVLVLVLLIFIGISLFAREIILIVTTPEYMSVVDILPILIFATIFNSLYLFTPGLSIEKKTGLIAIINIGQAIVSLVLNLLFIPSWGIVGAAVGTALSAALAFITNMFFSQKNYYVPHNWKQLGAGTFISLIVVFVGSKVPSFSVTGSIVKICLIFLCTGLFFVIDMLEIKDIRQMLTKIRNRNS